MCDDPNVSDYFGMLDGALPDSELCPEAAHLGRDCCGLLSSHTGLPAKWRLLSSHLRSPGYVGTSQDPSVDQKVQDCLGMLCGALQGLEQCPAAAQLCRDCCGRLQLTCGRLQLTFGGSPCSSPCMVLILLTSFL